jgi:hypothetical protein
MGCLDISLDLAEMMKYGENLENCMDDAKQPFLQRKVAAGVEVLRCSEGVMLLLVCVH